MSNPKLRHEWPESKIADNFEVLMGQSPPGSSYNNEGIGTPLLNGPTEFGSHFPLAQKYTTSPTVMSRKNDLLICVRGSTTGRMNWANKEYCIGRGLAALRPRNNKCDVRFLFYFLRLKSIELVEHSRGSTFPNLTGSKLKQFEIPLPFIEKQKDIVKKLDYVLGEIEKKQKQIYEIHRTTERNGQDLYKRVLGQRFYAIMQSDGDIEKKTLNEISESIVPGFAQGEKNVKDGIIHLRMNNIGTNFELNLDLTRTIDASPSQLDRYQLKEGDILFNNTNSSALVGKSAIFNLSDTICLYSNHLSRIRPIRHIVLPEWILFYFRSRWLKGDFEEMCHKWINQAAVGNEKIKKLEIPVPAIEIQRKRIEELKNISYVISEIKKNMNTIGILNRNIDGKFKKLYNQILASAYSGTW